MLIRNLKKWPKLHERALANLNDHPYPGFDRKAHREDGQEDLDDIQWSATKEGFEFWDSVNYDDSRVAKRMIPELFAGEPNCEIRSA